MSYSGFRVSNRASAYTLILTSLAEDIKALINLGQSLDIATQLAVADRNTASYQGAP